VCVDFIKGKCARETCKYFHPPEHLVAQLKKQKIANNAAVAAVLNANFFQHQFNAPLNLQAFMPLPVPAPTTSHFAHLHAHLRHAGQNGHHLISPHQPPSLPPSPHHLRSNLNFNPNITSQQPYNSRLSGHTTYLNNFNNFSNLTGIGGGGGGGYLMNPLQQQLNELQMVNLLNSNNNRNNFNSNFNRTTLNNSTLTTTMRTSNVSPNSNSNSSGGANSNTTNTNNSLIGNNHNNSNTQQAPSNFNAQLSAPAITAAAAATAAASANASTAGANNSLVGPIDKSHSSFIYINGRRKEKKN
jgi:hypothetical protein